MSYLSFNKKELINLEYALQREFLGTDRGGGYASSTIVGCNTRKYHGLLVLPIENFQGRNHVLLSSLDETIIQHGRDFNFGVHQYPNVYEPKGHKYVVDFSYEQCPVVTYQVGGVILRKEILLSHQHPQVFIRYTLVEAHSPTRLCLKPFLAFRDAHCLSRENTQANLQFISVNNGVKFKMYEGFPEVHLQLNKEHTFHYQPYWHHNIRYKEEQWRGYEYEEDLFVPGYFETTIEKGESIVFSASTSCVSTSSLDAEFTQLLSQRAKRNSFEACLKYSASQFVINKINETRIKSGYHWLLSYSRDTFIALPGIASDQPELFEKILSSIQKYFINGLFTRTNSKHSLPQYDADTSLWFFWTLQQYEKTGVITKKEIWNTYGHLLKEILQTYRDGSYTFIHMKANGLLWTEETSEPVSWMKTSVNGHSSIYRSGFLVEVNALWYNAIKYALSLAETALDRAFFQEWSPVSAALHNAFSATFWNEEKGYLADYHHSDYVNFEVRPNQIFACAFDFSPLNSQQRKKIVDRVTKELLTPYGLRTLSPNSPKYKGSLQGNINEKEEAIYNGMVHPWLMGFYIEAQFLLYGQDFVEEAERLILHFEKELTQYGICSIGEYFEGNPPFTSYGCISSAKSVGEILRSLSLINKYKKDL